MCLRRQRTHEDLRGPLLLKCRHASRLHLWNTCPYLTLVSCMYSLLQSKTLGTFRVSSGPPDGAKNVLKCQQVTTHHSSEIGRGFGLTQWTNFIVHAQEMPSGHDFKWCRVPKWKIMYNSGLKTFLDTHSLKLSRLRKLSSARPDRTSLITSGQLVACYQCCVLIGWVITRLNVIAHW